MIVASDKLDRVGRKRKHVNSRSRISAISANRAISVIGRKSEGSRKEDGRKTAERRRASADGRAPRAAATAEYHSAFAGAGKRRCAARKARKARKIRQESRVCRLCVGAHRRSTYH